MNSATQHVRIDSRITLYHIYFSFTDELSDPEVFISSALNLTLYPNNVSCNFSFQVAAVNLAGIGEKSASKSIDCKHQDSKQ